MNRFASFNKPTYIVFFLTIYAYAAAMIYEIAYLGKFDIGFEVIQITPPIIGRAIASILIPITLLFAIALMFFIQGIVIIFLFRLLKALKFFEFPKLREVVNLLLPVTPFVAMAFAVASNFQSMTGLSISIVSNMSGMFAGLAATIASILQLKNIGELNKEKNSLKELVDFRTAFSDDITIQVDNSSHIVIDNLHTKKIEQRTETWSDVMALASDLKVTLKDGIKAIIPYFAMIMTSAVLLLIPYIMGKTEATNYIKHPLYLDANDKKRILVRVYGDNLITVEEDFLGNIIGQDYFINKVEAETKITE